MFNAANDPVYDEKTTAAQAQRRQSGILMPRTTEVPPFYVFQQGIDGNQFGYITEHGCQDVGFNSYSDAVAAAEEFTRRMGL